MKLYFSSILIVLITCFQTQAQKKIIPPQTWLKRVVDSLHAQRVDTIIYYHLYCSECNITSSDTTCNSLNNDYTDILNIILYRHRGKYYALTYNCKLPAFQSNLQKAPSVNYFLSLIPTFIKRDKAFHTLCRQHKFMLPVISDGVYTEAVLFHKNKKYTVGLQWEQQHKDYQLWTRYFWISKEVRLLKLFNDDVIIDY